MAYDGWIEFNGVELVNLSRTAQLVDAMGIDTIWYTPESVQWIQDARGGLDYDVVSNAPWYDSGYPASGEFAGLVPLAVPGLDDSTLESTPVEYITNGGNSGKPRNATLPIVASMVIVASTHRGAEYGKRWMDRMLRDSGPGQFCSGADLRYYRYPDEDSPVAHRRNVRLTRGATVTKKWASDCAATWWTSFTLNAADPFEYGEALAVLSDLGGTPTGEIISSGSTVLIEEECPVYDYTPIYDPLYPALVAPPAIPDFYPDGWAITPGETFDRFWAKVTPTEPSHLFVVPFFTLTSDFDARMVRISIWDSSAEVEDQCDPLWSAVVSYLPASQEFIIDGEQQAAYIWDGLTVRRTDSLIYSPDAKPLQWAAFNDDTHLLVTLDIFSDSGGVEGAGTVRAGLALIPKSD